MTSRLFNPGFPYGLWDEVNTKFKDSAASNPPLSPQSTNAPLDQSTLEALLAHIPQGEVEISTLDTNVTCAWCNVLYSVDISTTGGTKTRLLVEFTRCRNASLAEDYMKHYLALFERRLSDGIWPAGIGTHSLRTDTSVFWIRDTIFAKVFVDDFSTDMPSDRLKHLIHNVARKIDEHLEKYSVSEENQTIPHATLQTARNMLVEVGQTFKVHIMDAGDLHKVKPSLIEHTDLVTQVGSGSASGEYTFFALKYGKTEITLPIAHAKTLAMKLLKLTIDICKGPEKVAEDDLNKARQREEISESEHELLHSVLFDEQNRTEPIPGDLVVKITNVLCAQVMICLLNRQGLEIQIPEDAIIAIARRFDHRVMASLLEKRGLTEPLTRDVIEAAAENSDGDKIIQVFLREGLDIPFTEKAMIQIAERCSRVLMIDLLHRYGSEIRIPEEAIIAIARRFDHQVMASLLEKGGLQEPITKKTIEAVTENSDGGKIIRAFFREGLDISFTEYAIVQIAERFDRDLMIDLLHRYGSKIQIPAEAVVAIAGRFDYQVMGSLLEKGRLEELPTGDVIKAAVENPDGEKVLQTILTQEELQISIPETAMADIARKFGHQTFELALKKQGSKVRITREIMDAARHNYDNTNGIMKLLLAQSGVRDLIEGEELVSFARYFDEELMDLLLTSLAPEVQVDPGVPQRMVKAIEVNSKIEGLDKKKALGERIMSTFVERTTVVV
ncbi:hypothetical protein Z517_08732 [Fonsecaea pedrosoi CBS 271.37]|uniref:Uncharacterized protein n=1 Tax=Fonsecaea pedrosoi CBS 271.37 TaxID=1442368 RepID=A0A0D2GDQ7_9EURO|nr:uncharacterized protein Z517_08732 [Fonsecaea pedrosoi CBS 271.37]KIW78893.1 hypothetical protein Z517_08732 [Fonsecaea pedrosoi CBS 271.37]